MHSVNDRRLLHWSSIRHCASLLRVLCALDYVVLCYASFAITLLEYAIRHAVLDVDVETVKAG
jgi:hypothetical protein